MRVITETSKLMPSPSKEEINTQLFNQIFDLIKNWDINVPDYYKGYTSGNGSHVKLLLDVILPALREDKINSIIDDKKEQKIQIQ